MDRRPSTLSCAGFPSYVGGQHPHAERLDVMRLRPEETEIDLGDRSAIKSRCETTEHLEEMRVQA